MTATIPRRPLAILAGWLCGHAALQCAVLGISMLGVRLEGPFPLLILLFAVLCGASGTRRALRSLPAPAPEATDRHGSLIVLAIWSYVAALFGQMIAIAWLRPIYDWDGLQYHLPAIHEWARGARVHWIAAAPDVPFVNGYPMGTEVVGFFLNQLFGHDRLVDAANLTFWPLAMSGIVVLARSLGAGRNASLSVGAAIALVPLWIAQSVTGYVDVAFAACCIALLAIATPLVTARGNEARFLGWLLGPALGMCAATKGLGIPFALFVFLALVVARLLRQHFPLTLAWRPIFFAPLWATLVAGYWPVRNLLYTGNPFHPIGLRIGSRQLFDGLDATEHTLINLPHWLLHVPASLRPLISWTQPDAPIVGYGAVSGLGYLWLLAGLPCAVALLVVSGRLASRERWHVVFLSCVCWSLLAFNPAAWWGRFTLWLHALGLPATAAVFQLAGGYPGAAQRALRLGLATLILGIGGAESMTALRAQWRDGLSSAAPLHFVESTTYVFPSEQDGAALDQLLASRSVARSPQGPWGTLLKGALAQPVGAREIRYVGTDARPSDLVGCEWLIWDVAAAGPCPPKLARSTRLVHVLEGRPGVNIELRRLGVERDVVQGESRIFKAPASRAANSR